MIRLTGHIWHGLIDWAQLRALLSVTVMLLSPSLYSPHLLHRPAARRSLSLPLSPSLLHSLLFLLPTPAGDVRQVATGSCSFHFSRSSSLAVPNHPPPNPHPHTSSPSDNEMRRRQLEGPTAPACSPRLPHFQPSPPLPKAPPTHPSPPHH